ncbi:MAG: hypothetical protein FDZ75_02470, partial [Actinobacteria bacterium]
MDEIITQLSVGDVYENPRHHREVTDEAVDTLAASIAVVGQVEPITVFADGEIYIVDSGHHRLAAIKQLGLATINAIVIDADDKHSAEVMVASNLHFPETDIERSRGTQLMLATGVRPVDAAAIIGERDTDKVERAARTLRKASDYAEDMTLERLSAALDFEDDAEAFHRLLTCYDYEWRDEHARLTRERKVKEATVRAEAIIAAAGCELVTARDYDTMRMLARGEDAPEGATWALISVYAHSSSVDIFWYGEHIAEADPEKAAREERDARITSQLNVDAGRRIEFIRAYLAGELPGAVNALRDLAVAKWEERYSASSGKVKQHEVLNTLIGFHNRVYAAVLASLESETNMALADSDGWYGGRYGQTAIDLIAALADCGYL